MRTFSIILAAFALLLAGCSSTTKLGAMLYCPHSQVCELRVTPPAAE